MPIPIQNSSESPAVLPLATQSEKIINSRRNSGTIASQSLHQQIDNDNSDSDNQTMSNQPKEHYRKSFQAQNQDYFQALNNGVIARSLDSNLAEVMDRMNMNANLNPFAITSSSPPHSSSSSLQQQLQGKDPIASITGQQHNNHHHNKQTLQSTSFNNNSLADRSSRGASPSSSFPHQYPSLQPTSINSSPGTNTHLALMERKNSFGRRSFNSGGGRGGGATMISVSDYDKLRAKITLPISPFLSPATSTTTNINNNIPLKSIPAEYLYNNNNTNISDNSSGDPTNLLLNLAMVHNNNIINENKTKNDLNNNNNLLLLLPSSDKSDNTISTSKNDPLTTTTGPTTDRTGNSQHSGESSEHSSKESSSNNKLDVVLFLERESNRRMSDLYSDVMMDRSRSTSGVTRDSEIEKLSELYNADEEMAFPMPPPTSTSDLTNFSATQMTNQQQQRKSGSNTQSPRQPSEQPPQQQQRRPSSAARQLLSASPSGQISESNTYYSLVVRNAFFPFFLNSLFLVLLFVFVGFVWGITEQTQRIQGFSFQFHQTIGERINSWLFLVLVHPLFKVKRDTFYLRVTQKENGRLCRVYKYFPCFFPPFPHFSFKN
jgi:hypothetical protein